MKRDELCKPGVYIATPTALAATSALNSNAKLVWAVIANHLGDNDEAWPSQKTIATSTALDVRVVERAIRDLKRTGWLTARRVVNRDDAGNCKTRNYYTLLIGPDEIVGTPPDKNVGTRPDKNVGYKPTKSSGTTRQKRRLLPDKNGGLTTVLTTEVKTEVNTVLGGCAASGTCQGQSDDPGTTQDQSCDGNHPDGNPHGSNPDGGTPGAGIDPSLGAAPIHGATAVLAGLTAEQQACTDLASMECYLRFGAAGLRGDKSKPGKMDWMADDPLKWSAHQFAGFVWYMLCHTKQQYTDQPLTTPESWGAIIKLCKDRLRDGELGPARFARRIMTICRHWPIINHRLPWANLVIGEGLFRHAKVAEECQRIEAMSEADLNAEYAAIAPADEQVDFYESGVAA
jgi:Helix-turn-helix domain